MSDYISALRQDLVEAAERQQRRSRAARAARPLHPRSWSPLAVLAAAAAVAVVVVVVMGLRAIEPVPRPSDAQIVTTVHVGGQPHTAVAIGSTLVIADDDGHLYRVSLADPRTRTQLDLGGKVPVSLAAAGDAVWVVTEDADVPPQPNLAAPPRAELIKLDPGSGSVLRRVPLDAIGDAIRAGAVGVHLPAYLGLGTELEPNAPADAGQLGNLVVGPDGLAWMQRRDTIIALDARGRIVRKVRGISESLTSSGAVALLPDTEGAWLLGQVGGMLYRIDGNRLTTRVRVGRSAGVLARVDGDLWVSAVAGPGRYEIVRVDGDAGRITGRVRLGRAAPQAIVPEGRRLWVLTAGGDALLINPA